MHPAAMEYVQSVLDTHTIPKGAILEIGGRNLNGTIRPLFEGLGPYASIDLYDGPGVDLVGDVCDLDPARTVRRLFKRQTVTCVVCCEVLEHAVNPKGICRWAHLALGPCGVFILTAANPLRFTHSGIDGGNLQDGEHYLGVEAKQLDRWLKPFNWGTITVKGSDIYATAWKGRRPPRRHH